MVFTIFFIMAVLLVLILKNPKNKYAWIFGFTFLSLNIMFFAIIIYIQKLSNFRPIFEFEYYVYIALRKININFYKITEIFNFGVALLMISMWCFINFAENKKYNFVKLILTFIPILLYVFITSYDFNISLYLKIKTATNYSGKMFAEFLGEHISSIADTIVIIYLICPFITFAYLYKSTQIRFKKMQYTVIVLSLLFVDLFYTYFFMAGPFSQIRVSARNILGFGNMFPIYSAYVYTYLPMITLVIFDVIAYLLIRYNVLDSVNFRQKKSIVSNSVVLTNDVRHVFHSYKNALFSIKILENKLKDNYGKDGSAKEFEQMEIIINQLMKSTGRFLNMFKDLKLNIDYIDIVKCLMDAVSMTVIPKNVRIINNINYKSIHIYGDYERIVEMFVNIISNSLEAIEQKQISNGEITLSIDVENDFICVYIRDSGVGIEKKILKKIFKPLYSTKKTYSNWGMGLSYVKHIMKAHLGFVFIESEAGIYTEIQLIFPNERNGGNDE